MSEEVDAVVVGGGHNGMVAACYLARAGLQVTVVEAADSLGGMTSTVRGAIPEAPDHLINLCAVEPALLRATDIVEDLGLARFGFHEIEQNPSHVRFLPDGESIAFWRDPRTTAEEIRRFSKVDGDAFIEFARTLDAALALGLPAITANYRRPGVRTVGRIARSGLRHRRDVVKVAAMLTAPFSQVLAEYFTHPIVRDAFTIMAAGQPGDGSGARLLPVGFYHRFGCGRPIGGVQALVDALRWALCAAGGTARTSSPVAQITIAGDRAVGVELENGEQIRARKAVLVTSDPRIALSGLLPSGTLDAKMEGRVAAIPAYADGVSHLKVDVALSGRLSTERYERKRADGVDLRRPTALLGSYEASTEGYPDARAGRLPERVGVWAVIPTAVDPSQAPNGQDTLYTYSWPFPVEPTTSWKDIEEDAANLVLGECAAHYDGLEEFELGRRIEGPDRLAERLRITNGCVEHVDFTLLRQGPLRPALGLGGYRTPVPGLFLGGAGSHPGPAVHGIPGRLAAREILRSVKA